MKIVVIGSGHVATHLAVNLFANEAVIVQVFSRNINHAKKLATQVHATPINNLNEINTTADFYIVAVKDDKIKSVIRQLPILKGLVVHTSGATPLKVLKHCTNFGVLYPLQTFSKDKIVDFKQVPICIEANMPRNVYKLQTIAFLLSKHVLEVNTEQRKILHLAAVFACNFTNHLYFIGSQLLAQHQLDFDILAPLIQETADKVRHSLPEKVQTGPAIRRDKKTINKHLALLNDHVLWTQIYKKISKSIKKYHKI